MDCRNVRGLARAAPLADLGEGDIVVLDNLNVHKSPRVAEILAKKNSTVRYLSPYSPDFNPIENAYSKLKSVMRKLAERTVAGLIASSKAAAISSNPPNVKTSSRLAATTQPERIPL